MKSIVLVIILLFTLPSYGELVDKQVDSLAIVMQKLYQNGELEESYKISRILLEHKQQLKEHPYCWNIIYLIVILHEQLELHADIPDIVDEYWSIVEGQLSYTDEDYYGLPFQKCIALLYIGKQQEALATYQKFYDTYTNSGIKNIKLESALTRIKEHLDQNTLRSNREKLSQSLLQLWIGNLAFKNVDSWKMYHKYTRNLLADFYYDTSNAEDEMEWFKTIICQSTSFNFIDSPEFHKGAELYDNILIYKDFLNFHRTSNRKNKKTWMDVRNSLSEEDIAIEIVCQPAAILMVKKESDTPIYIPLDSLLLEEIMKLSKNDPILIDELYKANGPLSKLWNLIAPSLNEISRIFISGSQLFTQINYSSIFIDNSTLTEDKYDIIQLETTADINRYKENFELKWNNVYLLGGIDYDNYKEQTKSQGNYYWTLIRGIPEELRGSFKYLPGSEKEIKDISKLFLKRNISHHFLSANDASESYIKGLNGKDIDILHISTHGFMLNSLFNSEDTTKINKYRNTFYQTSLFQSGLLLSGANTVWCNNVDISEECDGILTSKEISDLNLHKTKLVVLSACDTALGYTNNVMGICYGVLNAMKTAGVKKCIASLWKIPDYSTSIFYTIFYKNLIKHNNIREALKITKRQFRKDNRFTSPYYWASFVLVE